MTFMLNGKSVEVIYKDNELLFNPHDIKTAIGMTDAYGAEITLNVLKNRLGKLNEYEVKKLSASDLRKYLNRKGNNAGERFITERGLYKFINQYKSYVEIDEIMNFITTNILPNVEKENDDAKISYKKEIETKVDKSKLAEKQLQVREMSEKNKMASILLKLTKEKSLTEVQKNLLLYKAIEVLLGKQLEEVSSSITPVIEKPQVHKQPSIPHIPLKEESNELKNKSSSSEEQIILTDHTTVMKPSIDKEIEIEYDPRLDPTKKKLTKDEFRNRWLIDYEHKKRIQEEQEKIEQEIYGENEIYEE